MGGALIESILSHWWAGLLGPVLLALPRFLRTVAVIADSAWHLSQCNAREAALTAEVKDLRTAAERAVRNQTSGSASSGFDTSPTTRTEIH